MNDDVDGDDSVNEDDDNDDDDNNNSDDVDDDNDDEDDLDVEELGRWKEGGRAVELIGVKTVLCCERQVEQRVSVQVHQFQTTDFTWSFDVAGVHEHVRGCTCTQ